MIRTRRTAVVVLAMALPVAAVLGAGPVSAASGQAGVTAPTQPGVTPAPNEQAGVSSAAPAPPPRPQEQSLLGDLVPDPPTYAPSDYRDPPARSDSEDTSLGHDLAGLHSPSPVPPPAVIVPPPPDYIGVGDVKFLRPQQIPADFAWKINGYLAGWQRNTDGFFNSIGFNPSRSSRMATAGVLCAGAGFGAGALITGVPAAIAGALIGSTIGGIVGAGLGIFIPVPVLGAITSGVAGTALGAVAGAAVAGIPVALLGGAVTAFAAGGAGVLATAGDGSDFTPPPAASIPRVPPLARTPSPAPAPVLGPDVHDQVSQTFDNGAHVAEQAVHWAQAQPGGEQVLDAVANVGAGAGAAIAALPGAVQVGAAVGAVVHDVAAAAKAAPATAVVANAVADVVVHRPPFTPKDLGPFAGAANSALAAAQAVLR